MSYITDWITNIIFFILFAIVIELLIPNSTFQRYVKMVISLLLILIILTPILSIFNQDVEKMLSTMKISTHSQEKKVENAIENKKREIQASQRAYIEEQMAVQMEKQVGEELLKEYGYKIQKIELVLPKKEPLEEQIEMVHVMVKKEDQKLSGETRNVEVVNIDVSMPYQKESEDLNNFHQIQSFLATKWELSDEIVKVNLEGGENISYGR